MAKINLIKVSNTEAQEKEVYSRKEADLKFGSFKAESVKYMYNHYVRNPNVVPFWQPPRTGAPYPWDYGTIDATPYNPTKGLNSSDVGKIADGIYSYMGVRTEHAFIPGSTGAYYSVIAGKGNYITLANSKVPRAFLYHMGESKDVAIDTYGSYNKLTRVPNGASLFVGVPGREQYNIDLPLTLQTPLDYVEKQVITIEDFVAQLKSYNIGGTAPAVDLSNVVKYETMNGEPLYISANIVDTVNLKLENTINIKDNKSAIGVTNANYKWSDHAELLVAFTGTTGLNFSDNKNKSGYVYRMTLKQMLDYLLSFLSSPRTNFNHIEMTGLHNSFQDILNYTTLNLGSLQREGTETHKARPYQPEPAESSVLISLDAGTVHDVTLQNNTLLKIQRGRITTGDFTHTTGIIKITGANNITGYSANCVWGEVPKDLKAVEVFTYYCDLKYDRIYLSRM